jgi:hypothetical protein
MSALTDRLPRATVHEVIRAVQVSPTPHRVSPQKKISLESMYESEAILVGVLHKSASLQIRMDKDGWVVNANTQA